VTNQADIDAGSIKNTSTASGKDPGSKTVNSPISNQVTVTGPEAAPAISIGKTADLKSFNAVGQTITYTYIITNTGNVTLTGPFSVTDNQIGTPKGKAFSCGDAGAVLSPGQTVTCTAAYKTTQADIDAGSVKNTASAHVGKVDSDPTSVTVEAATGPAISIAKSADTKTYSAVDQTITYTYVITNTGNVTLTGPFTVTDNQIGDPKGTAFTCGDAGATLNPGQTLTCTAPYKITQSDITAGSVTNAASAHVTFGRVTFDSEVATVTATFTATPTPQPTLIIGGATGTPRAATPPPTNSGDGSSNGTPMPLFVMLLSLAFGGLGLLAVQVQRRAIRH
jgi:uncharacterized repeat protein (TIGR01451 family)